ncbi:hypothetical protein QE152_g7323 [Popillia japonica]|uniref:Uncharacterized protein n=1 Tax=Popillia japonica TaxID=7064 RepID=A0AAW1MFP8_POPJA
MKEILREILHDSKRKTTEIEEMKDMMSSLMQEIKAVRTENMENRQEIAKLRSENEQLKKEFEIVNQKLQAVEITTERYQKDSKKDNLIRWNQKKMEFKPKRNRNKKLVSECRIVKSETTSAMEKDMMTGTQTVDITCYRQKQGGETWKIGNWKKDMMTGTQTVDITCYRQKQGGETWKIGNWNVQGNKWKRTGALGRV